MGLARRLVDIYTRSSGAAPVAEIGARLELVQVHLASISTHLAHVVDAPLGRR
jgi:hypothetical protein